MQLRRLARRRRPGAIGAALLLLATTACTDLSMVREFGVLSASSASAFDAIVDDLQASDERTAAYGNKGAGQTYREQLDGMRAAHHVLESYLIALATLAADETIQFEDEYRALAGELSAAGLVEGTTADAASQLAALATKIATDAYRRGEIADAIAAADADVTELCDGLIDMVGIYVEQLDTEMGYIQSALRTSGDPSEKIAGTLLAGAKAEQRRRAATAAASARILKAIAATHHQLYEHRGDLDVDAIGDLIASYRSDMRALTADVRRARRGVTPLDRERGDDEPRERDGSPDDRRPEGR